MQKTNDPAFLFIAVNELPADGQEKIIEDQSLWQKGLVEFGMDVRITSPLQATVELTRFPQGCLVKGHLGGEVALPCRRCAEEIRCPIDYDFEDFEELPVQEDDEEEEVALENDFNRESRISLVKGVPMLDLKALLWEEFMLALPDNPLCKPDCQGLCPVCGCNRNLGSCSCAETKADPRMAVFRTLTLDKNKSAATKKN
ncbi:MAG: DUF177 domain-containing protein [Desulfovibrio sp.]|nr:DUF177 domain-containing protein [Desulfovibrio sp.]